MDNEALDRVLYDALLYRTPIHVSLLHYLRYDLPLDLNLRLR
jgi:hypothetical protein